MVSGIYIIKNLINNKVYVGSSINLNSREYKHFWMLDKGMHDNHYLQQSYNKHGKDSFIFEIVCNCEPGELVLKENYYIDLYKSNKQTSGYNLAKVNEFRRNTYNDEVKINLSKYNLEKNGNFKKFSLINILTEKEYIFDSLVDAANYLLENGFAKGKPKNVRMKISNSLRGKKLDNGSPNGSIRKTCYKHRFKIIN